MAPRTIPAQYVATAAADVKNRIEQVSLAKKTRGRDFYSRYLSGKPIGLSGAVLAKCGDCMAMYDDGLEDCEQPLCPLYPWMPYRAGRKTRKPEGLWTQDAEAQPCH